MFIFMNFEKKVHETNQKGMTVSAHYSELQTLWHELDCYQNFQVDCAVDSTKFKKLVNKERVYDFLVGLNLEYHPIRI